MIGKLVWAAVSTGIAFGLNWQMHPVFEAAYERAEVRTAAGTLTLNQEGTPIEITTLAGHVVVADVKHLGKIYSVRELSLRSLAPDTAAPSFELFASLPATVAAEPGRPRAPDVLRGAELAVRESGRLGAREAFVKRQGNERGRVLAGSVLITDVSELFDDQGVSLGHQAVARVELQLETSRGVDMVTGRWTGRLVWSLQ